jgi:hypothetical protein
MDLLAGIVSRSVPVAEAARHDRACAAFADPVAQAGDSAVLAAEDWSWLDTARIVDVHPVPNDDTSRVLMIASEGTTYEAEVAVFRTVPVPHVAAPQPRPPSPPRSGVLPGGEQHDEP